MPLYEFQCDACQHRFERIQKYSDPPADVCPSCGKGPIKKLMSSPAIQFKGTGWYVTDYARKSGTDAGKASASGESSSASSSSEGSKPETKAETKPDTKKAD